MNVRTATRATRSEDSGAVALWVALLSIVFLGVAALAVDLGYAYAVKRQLSATADSTSLAGAQEAALQFNAPGVGGCGPTLDALVVAAVNANHAANAPDGATGNPTTTIVCTDKDGNVATGATDPTSITVQVDEASTLSTWFGRILGWETLQPNATATSRVFGSTYFSGLRPFLVCLPDARDAREAYNNGVTPTPMYQSYYRKFLTKSDVAPTGLVEADADWDQDTDLISTGQNHDLVVGDYVRLENITAAGIGLSGTFYYVVEVPGNKDFKVSPTPAGTPVDVTTTGTVDVYLPTPDIAGATWSGETVNAPDHGLTDESNVWVQVTSGEGATDGSNDGSYIVESEELQPDTFRLTDGTVVVEPAYATIINVYKLTETQLGGDGCSPPGSSGNWGYSAFDFNSGDNWQLACLIKFGYGGGSGSGKPDGSECLDADPSVPGVNVGTEAEGVPSEGDQGNNLGNSDGDLIRQLIIDNNPILLPVGSNWNAEGGNNAQYAGRGALAVYLCGYTMPGNKPDTPTKEYYGPCGEGSITGNGSKAVYLQSVADGKVDKDVSLVIQWIYSDWVFGFQGQPSDAASQCPLGKCVASLQLLE